MCMYMHKDVPVPVFIRVFIVIVYSIFPHKIVEVQFRPVHPENRQSVLNIPVSVFSGPFRYS